MEKLRSIENPGWFWMNNELVDHYAVRAGKDGQPLGAYGMAIYMVLARCARKDGRSFVSLTLFERMLGIARKTVKAYLRRLEEVELIRIVRRTLPGRQQRDITEFLLLEPASPGRVTSPPPESLTEFWPCVPVVPNDDPSSVSTEDGGVIEGPPSVSTQDGGVMNGKNTFQRWVSSSRLEDLLTFRRKRVG